MSTATPSETSVVAEVFVADLTRMQMVALDARDVGADAERVAAMLGRNGTTVVVNGTFFARDGAPLGLLRQGDRELSPLRDADWGVLEIVRRRYAAGPGLDEP